MKLKTFAILYSILTESGEYPREKLVKGKDKQDAELKLKALFAEDGTTHFVIHDVILQ
jgi:hypothetical protein